MFGRGQIYSGFIRLAAGMSLTETVAGVAVIGISMRVLPGCPPAVAVRTVTAVDIEP